MIDSGMSFAQNRSGMGKPSGDIERTSVGVTIEARDALVGYLATKRNPTMRDVVSALIMQFIAAPDPVKSVMLDGIDRGMEEAYAEWLEGYARQLRERASHPNGGGRISGSRPRKAVVKNG